MFKADETTLTAGDRLDGGNGVDKLAIISKAGAGGAVLGADVVSNGIEEVSIEAQGANATALVMTNFKDVTAVGSVGSTAGVTYTNVQAIPSVSLQGSSASLTVAMAAAAVAGLDDSLTVKLNTVATSADNAVTVDGIEKVTVAATGAVGNKAGYETTIVSNELESVTVTGSSAIRLNANLTGADLADQVGVFDASATTGGVTSAITAGDSGKLSVTGGSGDDVLVVTVSKDVTVAGGTGTDTLVASGAYNESATTQVGANVSGFELASGNVDQRAFTNNTFLGAVDGGKYTYVSSKFGSVTLVNGGNVTVDRATDTTADELAITISATTNLTSTFTVAEEEKISINAGAALTSGLHTITLAGAEDLTEVVVTGSNSVNLGAVDSLVLKTVDASALKGSTFTVDASASNVAMTIKGSAGVPVTQGGLVNTLTGGSKADSITGGAYKDILAGGAGADTINGGAGNDVINGDSGDDVIDAGEGENTVNAGSGDDKITTGADNDLIDAGTGDDTVVAGAGNDMIIDTTITDDTDIDGGAGTDVLAAVNTTGTTFGKTVESLETAFITVDDDAAPTIAGIETAYVSIDAGVSEDATTAVELDMTDASVTALNLELADSDGDSANDEYVKLTNFKGSSITLFGGTEDTMEAAGLAIDGASQASLTLNLEEYAGWGAGAGATDITVTGVDAFTLAGKSKSMFTGAAGQANEVGDLTANSVSSLTISSSGSSVSDPGSLTVGAVKASTATAITLSAGAADTLEITSVTASGDDTETVTVTVGADAALQLGALDLDKAVVDTMTVTVGEGAILADSVANSEIIEGEMVALKAASIDTLKVTLSAGAVAALDLQDIEVAAGTFAVGTGAELVLSRSLGASAAEGSFVFSGRGTVAFDANNGSVQGGVGDDVILVGDGVTFNTSGLTVFDGDLKVTGTDGDDVIRTGLGDDSLAGGEGNDVISGGAGNDSIVGGIGADVMTGGTGDDDFQISYNHSAAATASTAAKKVTFGSGIDVVADFSDGDELKLTAADTTTATFDWDATVTFLKTAARAATITADGKYDLAGSAIFDKEDMYYVRGDLGSDGVFTESATGKDALIFLGSDGTGTEKAELAATAVSTAFVLDNVYTAATFG